MWCEQPDREREERRLMSKMPKLKTRRNEKLKNSVFSLNESSVSPMIIREKCQWQWNTRTVQYSAVHPLLHTPWLSALMFQIISCWWRLRCNTASVTRVTRTRDTWHSQPVYLRAAQGPARHLIMLMFVRRAAYSSTQHSPAQHIFCVGGWCKSTPGIRDIKSPLEDIYNCGPTLEDCLK